ncbi:MAG: hypothetical protein WCO06_02005 [Candidatus Roizmanbacteria bacterium]
MKKLPSIIFVALLVFIFLILAITSKTFLKNVFFLSKTSTLADEKSLKIQAQKLIELSNENNYEEIYLNFMSSNIKKIYSEYIDPHSNSDPYKYSYLETIRNYYKTTNIQSSNIKIHSIKIEDAIGYIKRTLTICYDKLCKNNSTDTSTVPWIFEQGQWRTSQEQPICIRKPPYNTSTLSNSQKRIRDAKTQVEIVWQVECDMFPLYFFLEPINSQVTPLANSEIKRSIEILQKTFQKYPSLVLKKYLQKVYLVKSLTNFGASYGGTNVARNIYLANNGVAKGYTDLYIEQMFHHEFSSILLAYIDTSYDRSTTSWKNSTWTSFNKNDFKYGTGGYNEINSGTASQDFETKYQKNGFLNQYSTTSMENDFNEIVMNLFVNSKDFWIVVDKNPILTKKASFVINFYHSIDPQFTEEFFRNM